jgi:hypothetical protein
MRLTTLAVFLSSGTAALCQLAAPNSSNPEQHWLTAPGLAVPGLAEPGRDFTKIPPRWHFDFAVPISRPAPGALHQRDDAQIDPKIIVHPPESSVGEQPPGTQLAQNLYPGLSMLPIQESQAKGQPIPTTWPNLKVHNIPVVWPKFEIKPVESSATRPAAGK